MNRVVAKGCGESTRETRGEWCVVCVVPMPSPSMKPITTMHSVMVAIVAYSNTS